jgi:predicted nucleic acid-binding protein
MAVSPMVSDIVDEALFADLKAMGLPNDSDARHLMYAVENKCDRFVTLDPDFLDRRDALHVRCPTIRIVRPSELAAELKLCH